MAEEFTGARAAVETTEALLVEIDGDEYWIPKSVILSESEIRRGGESGTLVVKSWFAERMSPVKRGGRVQSDGQASPTPIVVTRDQREVIERAVEAVREQHGARGLTRAVPEGRCLELVCADYLAGQGNEAAARVERLVANLVELAAAVDSALGEGTVAEVLAMWRANGGAK